MGPPRPRRPLAFVQPSSFVQRVLRHCSYEIPQMYYKLYSNISSYTPERLSLLYCVRNPVAGAVCQAGNNFNFEDIVDLWAAEKQHFSLTDGRCQFGLQCNNYEQVCTVDYMSSRPVARSMRCGGGGQMMKVSRYAAFWVQSDAFSDITRLVPNSLHSQPAESLAIIKPASATLSKGCRAF